MDKEKLTTIKLHTLQGYIKGLKVSCDYNLRNIELNRSKKKLENLKKKLKVK